MVTADAIIAQIEAQRRAWVPVDPAHEAGPAVWLETPSQFAAIRLAGALRSGDGDQAIQAVCAMARDWRGLSQADLLGAGVGSTDPAPFHPRLLAMWLADRPDEVAVLAMRAMELASAARERVQGAQGN